MPLTGQVPALAFAVTLSLLQFLPSLEHKAHISQAAKFDPSSKIYEISNRWKLASQVQVQKEPKEATKKKVAEQTAAREEAKEEAAAGVLEQAIPVRQQAALENATKKRERATSDLRDRKSVV